MLVHLCSCILFSVWIYGHLDLCLCLFGNLGIRLGACYPWPERSQVCRHALNSFPKSASFLHSLWVYWWLFFTRKSPTHNNIEPKPSTTVIWASGISTFMYCNYFVSSYLSNIIHKLPWHLFCYRFWAAKNSAGGSSVRFSIITWIFVDFNNFSAVRFSFWWYDILMLNFCSAYLYTCPGSAFSPFSITDFFLFVWLNFFFSLALQVENGVYLIFSLL